MNKMTIKKILLVTFMFIANLGFAQLPEKVYLITTSIEYETPTKVIRMDKNVDNNPLYQSDIVHFAISKTQSDSNGRKAFVHFSCYDWNHKDRNPSGWISDVKFTEPRSALDAINPIDLDHIAETYTNQQLWDFAQSLHRKVVFIIDRNEITSTTFKMYKVNVSSNAPDPEPIIIN